MVADRGKYWPSGVSAVVVSCCSEVVEECVYLRVFEACDNAVFRVEKRCYNIISDDSIIFSKDSTILLFVVSRIL